MNSTSLHRLNADKPLNRTTRKLWIYLNWINNHFLPNLKDPKLEVRGFVAQATSDNLRQIDLGASPTRKLGDLFWIQLPWKKILEQLGEINILDSGCGSGHYGVKLQSYSQNRINSYTGIDLFPNENWKNLSQKYPNFHFHQTSSENIFYYIPEDTNFFISQSAIEHFEKDLHYFKQLKKFTDRSKRSVLQVHLFPSVAGLKLYGFHGIRQYNIRAVSKITRLFNERSNSVLYKLGGEACTRVHWEFISKPVIKLGIGDLRKSKPEEYNQKVIQAIEHDNHARDSTPSFYGLVIQSNWDESIFQ